MNSIEERLRAIANLQPAGPRHVEGIVSSNDEHHRPMVSGGTPEEIRHRDKARLRAQRLALVGRKAR